MVIVTWDFAYTLGPFRPHGDLDWRAPAFAEAGVAFGMAMVLPAYWCLYRLGWNGRRSKGSSHPEP